MKKTSPKKDITDHAITGLLLEAYTPLLERKLALKKDEVFQLKSPPDWEIWNSAITYIRLTAHLNKLDHCILYLKNEGKTGKYKRRDWAHATQSDWIEYHVGYFYTLHRSVYDCMLWFINNLLNLNIPIGTGFDSKVVKVLSKYPNLAICQPLEALKIHCERFKDHRNDHIHRGTCVKTSPIAGDDTFDQFMGLYGAVEFIKRVKPDAKSESFLNDKRLMIRWLRNEFIGSLKEQVNTTHDLIWNCLNPLHVFFEIYLKNFKFEGKK